MVAFVFLILTVATVASATRLLHMDVVSAPLRVKIRNWSGEHGFFTDMLECPRCCAVWVSPPVTAALGGGLLAACGVSAWTWLIAALLWIPVSFGISYLAYLLILSEGND